MLALCVGQEPAAGHRGCIRPVGGRGSTCRLIACSTGAGEPSGRRHGSCRPRRRGRSNLAPPVDGAAEHHRRALHPEKGGPVQRRGPPARYRYARPGKLASRHVHRYRATPARPGSPASPRHAGRRPPDRCAPGCPRRRPALRRRRTSSRRSPANGTPWSRTKPSNRCGAASTASCPALASPLGSATNGCTSPLVSSVRISSFAGRLAHRGSGPSVPSTRAATPSSSPWTLRPVRHGACGRRSSRQRPPRTRPH